MAKFIPPGFDAAAARQGILNAMSFGEPTRTEDKAWFYFPRTRTPDPDDTPADSDGVPFDPTVQVAATDAHPRAQVPCAVEFFDGPDVVETFGDAKASHIEITLMDTEYQRVKGFSFVVAGGDKYVYTRTQPPVALGSIDVWTIRCDAEAES